MNVFSPDKIEKHTLSECLLRADDRHFRDSFKVNSKGMVIPQRPYFYSPEETSIHDRFMLENPSDKRGYSMFFLIETADGRRGYLVEEQTDFSEGRVSTFVKDIPGSVSVQQASRRSWLDTVKNFF